GREEGARGQVEEGQCRGGKGRKRGDGGVECEESRDRIHAVRRGRGEDDEDRETGFGEGEEGSHFASKRGSGESGGKGRELRGCIWRDNMLCGVAPSLFFF